jgi:MFS family permease
MRHLEISRMAQTFIRNRYTWLAYLLLTFYGYFLNVFGPITPFLKDELNLSYTWSSFHFSAFAVGIIIVGLGGHHLIQRVGRMNALWIGAFGMSLSSLILIAGRTPVLTIGAAFLMGLVGSLILAVVPSTLSDAHGENRAVAFSEANVISSLISTGAPLLVGWFSATVFGWRMALFLPALVPLILFFVFGKVHLPVANAISLDAEHNRSPLPILFWVYWSAIVLAVSVEFCMIFWSADYMEKILGLPKAQAAQAVSLFLAGMIAGRLASSRLVQHFATHKLVSTSILISALGFGIFWSASSTLQG